MTSSTPVNTISFWESVKSRSPWCRHIAPWSLINPNYADEAISHRQFKKLLSSGDGGYGWVEYTSDFCDKCGAKRPGV